MRDKSDEIQRIICCIVCLVFSIIFWIQYGHITALPWIAGAIVNIILIIYLVQKLRSGKN